MLDETKLSQRIHQEKMKFNEDQKTQLEETLNNLRSENQKLEFKFVTMEAELTSQRLINDNYIKELEEYRKNLKLVKDKFEEYSHIKEQEARNMKEELIIINNKAHSISEENDFLREENQVLKNDLDKLNTVKIEDDEEKSLVIIILKFKKQIINNRY